MLSFVRFGCLSVAVIFWSATSLPKENFKAEQLKFERVKAAYDEKEVATKKIFSDKGLNASQSAILVRVFKQEKELELWAKPLKGSRFQLLKTYRICSASGGAGPKRRMGDNQVPEGFYTINRWNPQSSFHLSLGINYPNASDMVLSDRKNPGGDIFIHGDCVSIGCMAMTDDPIKEIYIAFVEATTAGQARIPVHISPARPESLAWEKLRILHRKDAGLLAFWQNLKTGHDAFGKSHALPRITVDARGLYLFE